MTRTNKFTDADIGKALDTLLAKPKPEVYRDAMHTLGIELAKEVWSRLGNAISNGHQILLACTVEDADFLAKGMVDFFGQTGSGDKVRLACFWNARSSNELDVSIAPVVKQYVERTVDKHPIVIIVKSVISGTCVVKTNISKLISLTDPESIFVAAPVMLKGAEAKLSHIFPKEISDKFQFVAFAEDAEKDAGGNVLPGIGGSVYELYGFSADTKNKYVPEIVKERRLQMA